MASSYVTTNDANTVRDYIDYYFTDEPVDVRYSGREYKDVSNI